jgi:hypothetical protein
MTCPICGREYTDLVCKPCAERTGLIALLAYQPPYLTRVAAGEEPLKLARQGKGRFHVELCGDPGHAFCGQPLEHATRQRVAWRELKRDRLCAACMREIKVRL